MSTSISVYPCLWYCVLVLKALLGTPMAQCESAVDKRVKVPRQIVDQLDRWFLLITKVSCQDVPIATVP